LPAEDILAARGMVSTQRTFKKLLAGMDLRSAYR